MVRITVLGGTGYAGAAIVAEAASRGHDVVAVSRSLPAHRVDGVRYRAADATDEEALREAVDGSDVVIEALAPRGPLAEPYRDVVRRIAALADAAGARLVVVGGYSSLRPAAGAPRFVTDLTRVPSALHHEVTVASALVSDDLPATPDSLDWVFVSPPLGFGAYAPGTRTGRYRLGGDVALDADGGAVSAEDFAIGVVDLALSDDHRREHVSIAG